MGGLGYVLNYGVSLMAIAALTAMIFKILPDARVAWKGRLDWAFVTSVLFHWEISDRACTSGAPASASAFGAAGSLAVLLVWIYYSAQLSCWVQNLPDATRDPIRPSLVATKGAIAAPETPLARLAARLN